jgi:hypothetical protein
MTRCNRLRTAILHTVCGVALFWMAGPRIAAGSDATTFEHSVLKGNIPQAAKDYYAAVWTSLGFFHETDSARQTLAPFDVVKQKTEVDSVITVLFLPLDSDPITPGNSFLQGLSEKIDYCCNRGFLHTGGPFLAACFDDIGLLILLNGLPDLAFVLMQEPKLCGRKHLERDSLLPDSVPTYHVSWEDEDYIFQEDCWGYWRLLTTEFPRGGGDGKSDRFAQRSFAMQKFNEQLIGGVAIFDPDEPLSERSAIVQPVAILDSTDWQSSWSVINLGLRAKDFVRDSSGWKRLQMHGALSVATSGSDNPSLVDSVSLAIDLGREKPGGDDLVALQRVEKSGENHGEVRGRVLGVDIANPKDKHWKKSIPFPVGWFEDSLRLGYGWLLNPKVVNANYIGGRPPLIHDVVTQGDSLLLFFQLTRVDPDLEGRFRTHVKLRFIREEEREWEVVLSKLYRLGKEPLTSTGLPDVVSAAVELRLIQTSSANANVTFGAQVPAVREGFYRIVAECHQTTGADDRPFAIVIFSHVHIKEGENQVGR